MAEGTAHPRAGGENDPPAASIADRMWLIPARAGKTIGEVAEVVADAAHPRAGGENRGA